MFLYTHLDEQGLHLGETEIEIYAQIVRKQLTEKGITVQGYLITTPSSEHVAIVFENNAALLRQKTSGCHITISVNNTGKWDTFHYSLPRQR